MSATLLNFLSAHRSTVAKPQQEATQCVLRTLLGSIDRGSQIDPGKMAGLMVFQTQHTLEARTKGTPWLEISNLFAAIAGRLSHFLRRIRNFSETADTRRPSAARHAGKPRRTSSRVAVAAVDTSAAHLRIQA
jgi:hypothetical protein